MRLPQGERYRITEKSACAKTTRRRPKRQILKHGNHVRRLICGRYRHHESAVRTLARGARHRVRPAASRGPAGLDMTFTPPRPAVKPHARNRAGPGGERPCRRRGPRRTSGLNAGLERTATPGTSMRSPIAAAFRQIPQRAPCPPLRAPHFRLAGRGGAVILKAGCRTLGGPAGALSLHRRV